MKFIECPYCGQKIKNGIKLHGDIYICAKCKKEYLFYTLGMKIYLSKLDWVVEANRISNLYKLPSEQQEAVQKAIEKLENTKSLGIFEPCDCGSHIRHNNGGNYHTIYYISSDNGYYIMEDSTCELLSPPTWKVSTKEEVYQLIQNCADWIIEGMGEET